MKIQICETTISTKNIDKIKDFYSDVLGQNAGVEHLGFFYKVKDKQSLGTVCIVPHNGESKWNEPWITFSTDDLPKAIEHIRTTGIDATKIETFGAADEAGNPVNGITFRDPDGRLVMLIGNAE